MDTKTIQVGNYTWNSNKIIENISNENLENKFYSWGEFSIPSLFTQCDGSSLAIRKCTLESQLFIECDFSGIDASDSTFINCLFLDCKFKNANLYKANFIGTAIIQDKNKNKDKFGAGVSQTKFRSSNQNHSILSNLRLDGCSFRHSVFNDVIFNEISIAYTSFEDAYFNECKIDTLDLRSSACRGIIIKKCKIEKYISSVEKTLAGIGTLQALEVCKDIELYILEYKIEDLETLAFKLKEVSQNFLSEGKLFEFVNIMNYLHKKATDLVNSYISSAESNLQLSIQKGLINGYPVSDKGIFLHTVMTSAYETINNSGNEINLDDILYSLKLIYFLNVNEYTMFKFMLDIYKNEILTKQSDYSDFLVISQIKHYFQAIGERIKSNKYQIIFHNQTASWNNREDRNNFYDFCKTFIIQAVGDSDFKLVSMREGSIDAIFESLFNIYNILIVSCILGFRFHNINGKPVFDFYPANGIKSYAEFIKVIASIAPLLGEKKPTEDNFNNIFKKVKNVSETLKKYLSKNNVKGAIKQNDATKEIEETIKESRIIEQKGDKIIIHETIVTKRKIREN